MHLLDIYIVKPLEAYHNYVKSYRHIFSYGGPLNEEWK